jgi:trk system potassium uptake protein TrkA
MDITIVGAGEVGVHLAQRLSAQKHNITILERNSDTAKRAGDQVDANVVTGSGSSFEDLKRANIESAELFAALSNVDEVNLLGCLFAKRVGVPHKIARVRNPEYAQDDFILTREELGLDHIIHPERETADAIVRLIRQSSATDVMEFAGGKIQLLGIRLESSSPILLKPLKEVWREYPDLPARIVAISRRTRTIIPGGDDLLMGGDQIFLVCEEESIPAILQLTGKENVRIENIMILGGGLISRFVAKRLEKDADIKIIESREEKSEEIADALSNALVIHGDGTDMDLLAAEGIVDMDCFIAVTGDDETNIISTLMARHLKVPRTIALVNKTDYLPITTQIGMDAVVSKKILTVNAILRFIRRTILESIATIPGVDAEIIEIIPQDGSKITKKPLRDIRFPRSSIVGAVLRNGEVIIPTGDTHIRARDRTVVFSLPVALEEVEKLFS